MENNKEKKTITIGLNTFIFMVLIFVIIIVGATGLYLNEFFKKNKKPEIGKQIIEGNIVNEVFKNITDDTTNNKSNDYLDDKTAKELYEKAMLAIRDSYKYYEYDPNSDGMELIEGTYYEKTNSTYAEIESKYSEMFTGEALRDVMKSQFYNKNGMLYVLPRAGGMTPWEFVDIKVEKVKEDNEEFIYNAICKVSYSDDPAGKEPEEEKCQFKLKSVDGKYKISNYYNLENSETTETVSNIDEMRDMLKNRNEQYGAKYYYRLTGLRDNKNGTYTAIVDFYNPVYITEEKYNNMVNTGSIELKGVSYKFSKLEDQVDEVYGDVIDEGYGYITSNDKLSYCVERQGDKYAFYREIGGVKTIINNKDDSFEIILDEDTTVNVMFNGPEDGYNKLKDYDSELKRNIINNWTITFEYSEDEGICIGVDPR